LGLGGDLGLGAGLIATLGLGAGLIARLGNSGGASLGDCGFFTRGLGAGLIAPPIFFFSAFALRLISLILSFFSNLTLFQYALNTGSLLAQGTLILFSFEYNLNAL
jgi:uncharacterized membrane protein